MLRNVLLCGLLVTVMTTIGCAKREGDPPKAETAKAGLMPSVDDGFEPTYLADQKQVAMAGEVDVSLEPLETFRKIETTEEEAEDATSTQADDEEWAEEDEDDWGDEDDAQADTDETKVEDKSDDDTTADEEDAADEEDEEIEE